VAGAFQSLYPGAVQVAPTDQQLAEALVAFLQARGGVRRATLHAARAELGGAVAATGALAAAGIGIVPAGSPADVALLWLDDEETAHLLRDDHPPLLDKLWKLSDDSVVTWTVAPSAEEASRFVEAFQAAAGHAPSPQAWLAYEAARRLLGSAKSEPVAILFRPARDLLPPAR
jgi:ABC-type branched-subunit amino acid transport system substrate-binding protein